MAPFWEQEGLWRSQGERGWSCWGRWWLCSLPAAAPSHLPIRTFCPGGEVEHRLESKGTDLSVSPGHPNTVFPLSLLSWTIF